MFVDDGFVDEHPEAFGGLQLGTVRWQEDQFDAVRDCQAAGAVPAGIVEHDDGDAIASSAAGISAVRTVGARPLCRRRSPRASGPRCTALSAIQRGTNPRISATSPIDRPFAISQIA